MVVWFRIYVGFKFVRYGSYEGFLTQGKFVCLSCHMTKVKMRKGNLGEIQSKIYERLFS